MYNMKQSINSLLFLVMFIIVTLLTFNVNATLTRDPNFKPSFSSPNNNSQNNPQLGRFIERIFHGPSQNGQTGVRNGASNAATTASNINHGEGNREAITTSKSNPIADEDNKDGTESLSPSTHRGTTIMQQQQQQQKQPIRFDLDTDIFFRTGQKFYRPVYQESARKTEDIENEKESK